MFNEGQEILEKRYKVIKRLGGGAFGEIYKGKANAKGINDNDFYAEWKRNNSHVTIISKSFNYFHDFVWN